MSCCTTSVNSSTCSKETCAATLAATLTLYGCLDFHNVGINHLGNAPYPIRSPASPAHLLKVRRTIRFSRAGTSRMRLRLAPKSDAEDGVGSNEANSIYASSNTTNKGRDNNSS